MTPVEGDVLTVSNTLDDADGLSGSTAYALRGGALLASWISTVPVWSTLDPLPVVTTRKDLIPGAPDKPKQGDEVSDSADSLFAN